jgi:calcineurin-like phosphoesterase family protein
MSLPFNAEQAFVLGDYHFYHENALKYDNRPFDSIEEHNEALIENHNTIVGKKDLIIIAGDLSFGRHNFLLHKLNGIKILVVGNHDRMSEAAKSHFRHISHIYVKQFYGLPIVFCHYAMRTWPGKIHGSGHVYAHSHGSMPEIENSRAIEVSANLWDYTPVNIKNIVDYFKTIKLKSMNQKDFDKFRNNNIKILAERNKQIREGSYAPQTSENI